MFNSKLLFLKQKKILNLAKNFNNKLKKTDNLGSNPLSYMTTWVKTPGYYNLKKLRGIKEKGKFNFFLKDILSIAKLHDLEIIGKLSSLKKNSNLVISYSVKQNFKKNGIYYDEYFGTLTKKKNFVWILISLDNFEPKNLKDDIIIIKKKKAKSISVYYLIKNFFFALLNFFNSKNKNFYYLFNYHYLFSKNLNSLIENFFKNKNFKNVLINYESIPFQNNLIDTFKSMNKKAKFFCYLHCAPWPMQTEFIYKQKKIDTLILSSFDQKKVLIKYYNWPVKKIKVIPSLRFKKNIKNFYGGYLFMPFQIPDKEKLFDKIEIFLKSTAQNSLSKLKVSIHPLNRNSNTHNELRKKIMFLFKKYKSKFKNKLRNKNSIIFGNATGVCVQSLEEGNKVFHIPNDIETDVFCNKIWKNISVKQFNKYTYIYEIINKSRLFNVNNQKKKFERYIIPLIK